MQDAGVSIMHSKIWMLLALVAAGTLTLSAAEPELFPAVKRGDEAAVRTLLARKVDVNATESDSSTALDWAVETNNTEIANLLIDAGANVSAATRYKIT